MRSFSALLMISSLLWLGGCGKKGSRKAPPPAPESNRTTGTKPIPPAPTIRRFRIRDINKRETSLEFSDGPALFHRIRQPLVMIILFADWCPPCRGMIPYLSRLQSANSDELFVIGIPVRSNLDEQAMRRFMIRYETNFFISVHPDNNALGTYLARRYKLGKNYPLPLTLIFKNGRYVMHISGAVPYEMLQTLVNQLKEKKNKE